MADGTALAGGEARAGAGQRPRRWACSGTSTPATRRRSRPPRRGACGSRWREGSSTRARPPDPARPAGCSKVALLHGRAGPPCCIPARPRRRRDGRLRPDVGRPRRDRAASGHRRLPAVRLDRARTPTCASGSPARRPPAGSTSSTTGPATCGPGGAIPTALGRTAGCRHRHPPRLRARRRRLRRAARRGRRALAAVDALRARGFAPARPLGVAVFADEEGARFGVACAGSRLLTGALAPDRARALRDARRGDAWPRR